MTALKLFEKAPIRPLPSCELCGEAASEVTVGGLRCEEHTDDGLDEKSSPCRCERLPRRLRRARF